MSNKKTKEIQIKDQKDIENEEKQRETIIVHRDCDETRTQGEKHRIGHAPFGLVCFFLQRERRKCLAQRRKTNGNQ